MLNTKLKALVFGFLFSVSVSMTNFSCMCENISNKILRVHILANSDSAEDQSLKLKVRDEVINEFGSKLRVCESLECAVKNAENQLGEIESFAEKVVRENGFKYPVKAEITKMYFNIREYKEVTLPAGFYNALRITIGEGKGKNWWCVMFPPMCLPVAEEKNELSEVLSLSELDIVESKDGYLIKFKVLEFLMQVKNFLEKEVYEKIKNYIDEVFENIEENYKLEFKTREIISNFDRSK